MPLSSIGQPGDGLPALPRGFALSYKDSRGTFHPPLPTLPTIQTRIPKHGLVEMPDVGVHHHPSIINDLVRERTFDLGTLADDVLDHERVDAAASAFRQARSRGITGYKREERAKLPTVPDLINALLPTPESLWVRNENVFKDTSTGHRLLVARAMAGWSQTALAKALKVSPSAITKHETGVDFLSEPVIERAADLLGCVIDPTLPASWLTMGSGDAWWWCTARAELDDPAIYDPFVGRHPSWARSWLAPFARFIDDHRQQLSDGAQGFPAVPQVLADGTVRMQAFQVIEVRPIVMLRRLL